MHLHFRSWQIRSPTDVDKLKTYEHFVFLFRCKELKRAISGNTLVLVSVSFSHFNVLLVHAGTAFFDTWKYFLNIPATTGRVSGILNSL